MQVVDGSQAPALAKPCEIPAAHPSPFACQNSTGTGAVRGGGGQGLGPGRT